MPMSNIDRFKYLGQDIEKMKKFINQKYYNNSVKIRNFIPNSLLIDIEKKNLVSSATFQDCQHKKNLENYLYFFCDISYENFTKANIAKFKKNLPLKLAKKLGYQKDDKTPARITREINGYLKNYNQNLKNKLEIYLNLFIYIFKNLNKKIKYNLIKYH